MRGKLIKLLRNLENENGIQNDYCDYLEEYQCDYSIEEYLEFPNYKFIITKFWNKYYPASESKIKEEIRRMQLDNLVSIDTQEGTKIAYANSKDAPDFDEGFKFTTERILLTTKGKSNWKYFWYKATDNPVTTILSLIAIIISVISLIL